MGKVRPAIIHSSFSLRLHHDYFSSRKVLPDPPKKKYVSLQHNSPTMKSGEAII